MSKGGSQTQSVNVDPATQAYVNQLRQYALTQAGLPTTGVSGPTSGAPQGGSGFGNALGLGFFGGGGGGGNAAMMAQNFTHGRPMTPTATTGPMGQANPLYAQGRQLGGVGLSALGGDPAALQQLMGGYSGLLDPYWQQLGQQGLGVIGDQATQAGAYGGSRQGVAEGSFLGQLGMGQAAQRYGEYQNALGRAGQLANLGFGIDPQILSMLQGSIGPYGQTQTTQMQNDPFSQLLGGGLTIASLFSPGGLLAKGATAGASGAIPMVV